MDKKLKKLSRVELLELMISLSEDYEALADENNRLKKMLSAQRLPRSTKVGSIAEAALAANGYFESAQRSADGYLREIKHLRDELVRRAEAQSEAEAGAQAAAQREGLRVQADLQRAQADLNRAQAELQQAQAQAGQVVARAKSQAEAIVADARARAEETLANANRQSHALLSQAQRQAQQAPASGTGALQVPQVVQVPQVAQAPEVDWTVPAEQLGQHSQAAHGAQTAQTAQASQIPHVLQASQFSQASQNQQPRLSSSVTAELPSLHSRRTKPIVEGGL